MRKWMIVLAVLTVALTIGSKNANAQTEIVIGAIHTNSTINFTGAGPSATMTFGQCGGAATCTLTTTDFFELNGSPVDGFSTSTFKTTTPAVYALTATNPTGTNWAVAGPTMAYSFSSGAGTITGTVVWTQVISNGGASLFGTFTVSSVTGTLASTFAVAHAYPIDFIGEYSSGSLAGIFLGSTTTATATLPEGGAISATPEPSTMLLFGTGWLIAGGILRRRLA